MAPRLNKRQQRQQEELQALAGPPQGEVEEEESSKEEVTPTKSVGVAFTALLVPDEVDEESAEEDNLQPNKSKKPKKKKKKKNTGIGTPAALATVERSPPDPSEPISPPSPAPTPGPSKKDRKALKRAKAKEKKDGVDELDQVLAELSVKYPQLQNIHASASSSSSSSPSINSLLCVSLSHLDSEAEMRKFFGAKVISASRASSSSSPSRRQPGSQRSKLTRPQPTWPPAKLREGLSLRALTESEIREKMTRFGWVEVPGEVWWTVEYSKRYKGMTMSFMQTVMSGDPEGFWRLLEKLPWHADTLLQLAEAYRYRDEHSQAMDFIDRALFTYERAFVGSFNFTSGLNRLDFDRVENRPFFLAVHRQVADLQRRGCLRTSFEFARLLYSLDPSSDPHGALFHLEYLALKAGMSQWLLDVWDFFDAQSKQDNSPYHGRLDVTALPGWAYTRALALRMKEENAHDTTHEGSDTALRQAILAFPCVVPILADKADISLSPEVRGHKDFRIQTDSSQLPTQAEAIKHLLSHLYSLRSFSLWKKPSYGTWLSSTAKSLLHAFPQSAISNPTLSRFTALFNKTSLAYSVYRHVVVLETSYRSLFPFIPREVFSARQLACDPVPPPTKVNEYEQGFFEGVQDVFSAGQSRRAQERMLERLVPNAVFRRYLQEFYDAHPRIAERFPGGVIQFAQMAGQLPPDVLEGLMLEAGMEDVPGGLPVLADDFEIEFLNGVVDAPDHGEEGQGQRIAERAPEGHLRARDGVHGGQDEDEDEDDDEDEDEEEEEEVSPMPVRILRNIVHRFWGGAPELAESSESEDEGDPVDDGGVD